MSDEKFKKEYTEDLIEIAKDDLEASKILYDKNYYAFAIYHLQQAAEKAVKAYFVRQGVEHENLIKIGHDPINKSFMINHFKFSLAINEIVSSVRDIQIKEKWNEFEEANKNDSEFLKFLKEGLEKHEKWKENHKRTIKNIGNKILMIIARELVENIRKSVKIDWTIRESVQAQMKVAIKRILRKYGYPPDKQQKATETVLEQAKLLCKDLTA